MRSSLSDLMFVVALLVLAAVLTASYASLPSRAETASNVRSVLNLKAHRSIAGAQ